MTMADYERHVGDFLHEMCAVTTAKNQDYSAGQINALASYYELANAAGVTPFQAWTVLMMKHITAIMRYSKVGSVASESIRGRFIDLANYAMMGAALVEDIEAAKMPE